MFFSGPFASMKAYYHGFGWVFGPPPWLRPEIVQIDRECCEALECPRCGGSVRFEPVHSRCQGITPEHEDYVGLAVCTVCSHTEEF